MTPDLRHRAQSLRQRLPERRQASPPPEQGRRLATIPRPKDDEELRISWCEYEGHPYLGVRFWRRGDDGQFWPDKARGFSIRLRELPDVAEAIAEALELADQHQAQRARQEPRPAAPHGRAEENGVRGRGDASGADRRPGPGEFDEFGS
jgi:hypothetical protein